MKKLLLFCLLSVIVIYFLFLRIYTVKRVFPDLLDTYFEITLVGKNPYKLNKLLNETKSIIKEYERILNYFDENSELSFVNKNAKNDFVNLSDTLYQIIKIGYEYEELSNRRFSILLGEFKNIYNDIIINNAQPDTEQINRKLTAFKKANILFKNKSIKFSDDGVSLDLGGIAKGYVIDAVSDYCYSQKNIYAGLVNGGGDLRVFVKEDKYNKKWRIGIQHPRKSDEILEVIELSNGAIATSGDYQRFRMIDNERFHHIIDTQTGFPANKNISATVWIDKCIDADVLATLFFIFDLPKIKEFIINNKINVKYLIMDKNEKIIKNY